MMLAGVLFLFLFTGAASSNCSYDLLKHLKFSDKDNELTTMYPPVLNPGDYTKIRLDFKIYSILHWQVKEQQFITAIGIDVMWTNEFIRWNASEFCDIDKIHVPTKKVWIPDLTIEEMMERDNVPPSPYLRIWSSGLTWLRNDMVVIASCRMQVYKFPFDSHKCNISFKSVIHSEENIRIEHFNTSGSVEHWSLKLMQSQTEWLLENTVVDNTFRNNYGLNQSMVVYTVMAKRRALLYTVNYIAPILFFLGLDLASFLISDSGDGKLGFKVTVMLAVTVMQLILIEILPSCSDMIPYIALYYVGTFGLMMLSLLETILVMGLMEKDAASKDKTDKDQSLCDNSEDKQSKVSFPHCFKGINLIHLVSACDKPTVETPSELLQGGKEDNPSHALCLDCKSKGSSSHLIEESQDFEEEVKKALALLLSSREEAEEPGYWARIAKTVNKVFVIFYITSITLFLAILFHYWTS